MSNQKEIYIDKQIQKKKNEDYNVATYGGKCSIRMPALYYFESCSRVIHVLKVQVGIRSAWILPNVLQPWESLE